VVTTLQPGLYTMQVSSLNGSSGIALAEIYDTSSDATTLYQRLINISTRGKVTPNAGVLVNGFIVTGNKPKKILIRGVGPTLNSSFGLTEALNNPVLKLYNSGSQVIAQNDNWDNPEQIIPGQHVASTQEVIDAAAQVRAFPLQAGSRDAALVITLAPGNYTAQVSDSDGNTGVALIEIYEIPDTN